MQNNITEDYCSFEVSKLLKQKRFDPLVQGVYNSQGQILTYCYFRNSSIKDGDRDGMRNEEMICTSPTHSLAIKWIRENFGIWIYPHWFHSNNPRNHSQWQGAYQVMAEGLPIDNVYHMKIGAFKKPEQATEAALLYTLKNLIP